MNEEVAEDPVAAKVCAGAPFVGTPGSVPGWPMVAGGADGDAPGPRAELPAWRSLRAVGVIKACRRADGGGNGDVMVRKEGRRWGARVARLRWGGQLRAARRDVATHRAQAEADADPRYRLALARSQCALGELLAKVERPDEALPHVEEAVDLCRPLADTELARHRAVLAMCLGVLGELLTALVRPAAAQAAKDEAAALEREPADIVAFYRELAEADPDRGRPALAAALHYQASWLKQHDRPDAALPLVEEAIALRRGLAEADADPLRRIALARSLCFLGELLGQLDRPAEGLPLVAEAVELRRDLAAADTDPRRGIALALFLRAHCRLLLQLDRPAEALPFAREAVRLWRRVAESEAGDRRYRAGLAVSLHTLGELLAKLDRPAEGLPYAEEAVDLHRAGIGLLGRHRLAGALRTLGDVLAALDRPAEAQAAQDEATALDGETEADGP
ncbi:tetratricopeptide repeat protein [Streptomyces platensis]|uniref:tetratricopeptide repeat protein n=1 Tax=Streptomyces platensis TaxID=58346 RepID=UPI0030E42D70